MNQMEHNVKIKDFKRHEAKGPLIRTSYSLNYTQSYPNSQETQRMEERFRKIYWPRNKTLTGLADNGDRMKFTRNQQTSCLTNQSDHIGDVQQHRTMLLNNIKRNISVARDECARERYVARPGVRDLLRGTEPLYKIVNHGTLYG